MWNTQISAKIIYITPNTDGDNTQHKGNTMTEKKYELTKDVLTTASGSKVYRIRAVRTFTNGKNTMKQEPTADT